MNGALRVDSISQLHHDSVLITDCSVKWNKKVELVYTTINELKKSWAGDFAKTYTDAVDEVQPDLVDFANCLNKLSTTLTNVSNMYKALEEQGDVSVAEKAEVTEFNLTELLKNDQSGGVTFNSSECKEKASTMNEAATVIEQIIDEVDRNIESINRNYESDSGTELIGKVKKMKEAAPEYIKVIKDCANCLINVVAPQYEAIEKYAATGE